VYKRLTVSQEAEDQENVVPGDPNWWEDWSALGFPQLGQNKAVSDN
jgi:hypothetical protein